MVLVTGGGRGLGLAQAQALAQAGATVYALDIAAAPPIEYTEIAKKMPNLHYRTIDVRDQDLLEKTVRGIGDSEGRLDGLIAAAGVLEEVDALDYTHDQFNKIMDINVTGCFLSAQACAREMIRLREMRDETGRGGPGDSGGSIVLVASMSGVIANYVCERSAPLF